MDKWDVDPDTKKKFRDHEISGALDYENITGKTLEPSSKVDNAGKSLGDFQDVKTGEIIDHMGVGKGMEVANTPARVAKVMKEFKGSIDTHIAKLEKGVDTILLDLKGFNKEQLLEISEFMKKYTKEQLDKVFIINKNG